MTNSEWWWGGGLLLCTMMQSKSMVVTAFFNPKCKYSAHGQWRMSNKFFLGQACRSALLLWNEILFFIYMYLCPWTCECCVWSYIVEGFIASVCKTRCRIKSPHWHLWMLLSTHKWVETVGPQALWLRTILEHHRIVFSSYSMSCASWHVLVLGAGWSPITPLQLHTKQAKARLLSEEDFGTKNEAQSFSLM